jgi:hypothetical protein
MCNVHGPCSAGWAEELPAGCPPTSAINTTGQTMYRLVATPPTIADFTSHRSLFPDKVFRASECVARAVSMWSSIEKCRRLLLLAQPVRLHQPSCLQGSRRVGGA